MGSPIVIETQAGKNKVRICEDFTVGINRYLKVDDHPFKNIWLALDNIGEKFAAGSRQGYHRKDCV